MTRRVTWLSPVWTTAWKVALFLVLWGVLLGPLIVPFEATIRRSQHASPLLVRLYFEAASALTLLLAAWLMVRFVDRRSFVSLGFSPAHVVRDLLFGLGFGASWLMLSLAILWFAGVARVQAGGVLPGSLVAWSGIALLINTVAQEVLARSYVFQTVRSQSNAAVAVVVSALLFMAYHAGAYDGAWLPAVNVFEAGILFGLAYQVTGNLWLPIGMHFSWNFLLGPVLGLSVSGNPQLASGSPLLTLQGPAALTGREFGLEGGLVVTLTTILGIGALLILFRRRGEP